MRLDEHGKLEERGFKAHPCKSIWIEIDTCRRRREIRCILRFFHHRGRPTMSGILQSLRKLLIE